MQWQYPWNKYVTTHGNSLDRCSIYLDIQRELDFLKYQSVNSLF